MKIQELYSDESRWFQGSFAKTVEGDDIYLEDSKAYSFCLWGALRKCYPDRLERIQVASLISKATSVEMVAFNDAEGRTFGEVKELVDRLDI